MNARRILFLALGAVTLAALPWLVDGVLGITWVRILSFAALYVVLALGLNITVGYAGLLDLGYIAFFAVGAYTYALLASPQFGNPTEFTTRAAQPHQIILNGGSRNTGTGTYSLVLNLLGNTPLEQAMFDNLQHLGPPQWDDEDRRFAEQIRATLRPDDIAGALAPAADQRRAADRAARMAGRRLA
jgi:hypothetical protein